MWLLRGRRGFPWLRLSEKLGQKQNEVGSRLVIPDYGGLIATGLVGWLSCWLPVVAGWPPGWWPKVVGQTSVFTQAIA